MLRRRRRGYLVFSEEERVAIGVKFEEIGKGLSCVLSCTAKYEKVLQLLFGVEKNSDLTLEEFERVLFMVVQGSTEDVRFRLFKVAQESSFEELFTFVLHCTSNADFNTTLLVNSLKQQNDVNSITWKQFNKWIENTLPAFHTKVQLQLRKLLTPPAGPSNDTTVNGLKAEIVSCLKCSSVIYDNQWTELFLSSRDGLNFEGLTYAMIGYSGSTLIVIEDTQGNVFGALSKTEWKENVDYFGEGSNVLYSLWPTFSVYRTRATSTHSKETTNYQFLNTKSRTHKHG